MMNLLSAGFFRLWRSKSFWVSLAVMAIVGAIEPLFGYAAMAELAANGSMDASVSLDSRYIIFPFLSGILSSAFCALFVGAGHSDGGIRSKLAAGHRRAVVYLSELILCVTAGALLCLGYIAAVLATGIPLLGPMRTPLLTVLWYTLCAVIMTTAITALFTTISILCHNKAVAAVACIFLAYFLLFLGIFLNARLAEPEFYPAHQSIEDGQIVTVEARPNPGYIRGMKRAVYQFLFDLPGCQAVQLSVTMTTGVPPRLPLWSLASMTMFAGLGVALFRKKDLK